MVALMGSVSSRRALRSTFSRTRPLGSDLPFVLAAISHFLYELAKLMSHAPLLVIANVLNVGIRTVSHVLCHECKGGKGMGNLTISLANPIDLSLIR